MEASAAGVVTGFPKRDNIFEGNPLERIKPAESSPNPRSGMLDAQRVIDHVRQLDQAISLYERIPYSRLLMPFLKIAEIIEDFQS